MKKMTMVREKWGKAYLCDQDDNLCAMGWYGKEFLGFTLNDMRGLNGYSFLPNNLWRRSNGKHDKIYAQVLTVNDDLGKSKSQREEILIGLFAQIDVELNFVDTEADLKEESVELDIDDIPDYIPQKMTHTSHEAWA